MRHGRRGERLARSGSFVMLELYIYAFILIEWLLSKVPPTRRSISALSSLLVGIMALGRERIYPFIAEQNVLKSP
jgi:hypothetical protein